MSPTSPVRSARGSTTHRRFWRALRRTWMVALAGAALLDSGARAQLFELRWPERAVYRLDPPNQAAAAADWSAATVSAVDLVRVHRVDRPGPPVYFGPRVVLQVDPSRSLGPLLSGTPLRPLRRVAPGLWVLEALDSRAALVAASQLAGKPGVRSSRPVVWRDLRKHGPNVPPLNDPRVGGAWNLENRAPDGSVAGPDLNARQAWHWSRGERVVVGVADDGIEPGHPEFATALDNPFHFGFTAGTTNAGPAGLSDYHATLVAGFIAALDNNHRGIAGMAPRAGLASWKIFEGANLPLTDDQLAAVFEHELEAVGVQNHSWGNGSTELLGPTDLEFLAISNAVTAGRHGLGVVMVRSGGNSRPTQGDANYDGYANHPAAIAVGATTSTGRAAEYSAPGACLLVAAPGGGDDRPLITTDRLGRAGLNTLVGVDDSADYLSSSQLAGTSFSAPQVSGVVALMLSVNPALTVRDVRMILALSARHFDRTDPDLCTNGMGLVVSHNTGFGIPDAGRAVELARGWSPLEPAVLLHYTNAPGPPIPDDGLRVFVVGAGLSLPLPLFRATPGMGPQPDDPGEFLPLVDVGLATNDVAADLTGRGALILRGPAGSFTDNRNTFRRKIERVAAAGAAFAIVCNNVDGTNRFIMGDVDFVPIPAAMIDQESGETLRNVVASSAGLHARLQLFAAQASFEVQDTLRLETVRLKVSTTHTRRGDVRIVLRSPSGTRSVLQAQNMDESPGPDGWVYSSVHHLGEPSAGLWVVEIGDEAPGHSGTVTALELFLEGVPITDADRDGLDDTWEMQWLGSLAGSPLEDADGDGVPNGRECLEGSHPAVQDEPLIAWISLWSEGLNRVSWPGLPNRFYEVLAASSVDGPFRVLATVPAVGRETELFLPRDSVPPGFYRVRSRP